MHFSKSLDQWLRKDVILSIGSQHYTRDRCVRELGIANFRAAQNLSRALGELNVTTPKQLAKITPTDLLALAGVGERAVLVAVCLIDTQIGARESESWLHSDEKRRKRSRAA
jgi:hypothetical protein